jgi:hypothetical protein
MSLSATALLKPAEFGSPSVLPVIQLVLRDHLPSDAVESIWKLSYTTSTHPIYTYGLSTCIAVGVHFNGVNVLQHMYPHEYSDPESASVSAWKRLLRVSHKRQRIYIYVESELPAEAHQGLLRAFNDIGVMQYIVCVCVTVPIPGKHAYTSPWEGDFKFGIDKDGPWGYIG